MNIETFATDINKEIDRVKNSNMYSELENLIALYGIYHKYFVSLQKKYAIDGKDFDIKLSTLNDLNMHLTFFLDNIIKDFIIGNYSSLKLSVRGIIDFYYKFMFILSSPEEVSIVYNDFRDVALYNYRNCISTDKQPMILKNYELVKKKYNIKQENVNENLWVKKALDFINPKGNNNKSDACLINFLEENNLIIKEVKIIYDECCSYQHFGPLSLDLHQSSDVLISDLNNYRMAYLPMIAVTSTIIYDILEKYMRYYPEKKNEGILNSATELNNKILGV